MFEIKDQLIKLKQAPMKKDHKSIDLAYIPQCIPNI